MPPRAVSVIGSVVVSVLILLTFGSVLLVVTTQAVPPANAQIVNVMCGFLGAMASAVVGFWVGSTNGSQRKDQVIAEAQVALANSMPIPPNTEALPPDAAEEKS